MRIGARLLGGVAAGCVPALLAAAIAAAPAPAANRWVQITHQHSGSRSNLGLARVRGGTLHVIWAGPGRAPFHAILDTPISSGGHVGTPLTVLSGWSAVNPPGAVAAPNGTVYAVISGGLTGTNTDPFSGLNLVSGPGHWTLGSHAFGNASLTEASNAIVETALLTGGQLITVWRSATTLLFQIGTSPATVPQNITPPGLGDVPVVAVDARTGAAEIAYRGVNEGRNYWRQLFPSVGAPQILPPSKTDSPQIAARAGGGMYTAYTPDFLGVRLLRFGGRAQRVPAPGGIQVLTAGVAGGPGGRMWVYYGNGTTTYVTRTNGSVTRFERVQAFPSPRSSVQYFRLEGEGSAGPLDLFADVTVDGGTKDGSYYTQVRPALSLSVSRGSHRRVTVRVLDAGDPVAGARVSGIPGGSRTTGKSGALTFTGHSGRLTMRAAKAGYLSASASVTV